MFMNVEYDNAFIFKYILIVCLGTKALNLDGGIF